MRRLLLLLALLPCVCFAHTAKIASAKAVVKADGSFVLKVRFDVMAFVLDLTPNEVADGPMNALLDGPVAELDSQLADARARFDGNLKIADAHFEMADFPTAADVHQIVDFGMRPRLPVMMTAVFRGRLTKTFSLQFPAALGTVVLTTEFPYREPVSEPVEPGSFSTPLSLPTREEIRTASAGILANTRRREVHAGAFAHSKVTSNGEEGHVGKQPTTTTPALVNLPGPARKPQSQSFSNRLSPQLPRQIEITSFSNKASGQTPVSQVEWYSVFPRYVKMGFSHIIPQGLDHILFVLGLFFLSSRLKPLVKQITAFTIAHSVTLALALYGFVRLPPSIVEPLIALSIVFVAVENLFTTEMKPWRLYIVFAFGLVHGLGFASALQDAGLQRGDFLTALLGFNSGVELGQLSVVVASLLVFGILRKSERYRPLVAVPASILIALVAITWTVQRLV